MTREPDTTVVVIVSEAVDPVNAVIEYGTAAEAEPMYAVVFDGTKVAVNEWLPTASVLVLSVAVPLETAVGAPRLVPLSLNCTVPAAPVGEIEAERVTAENCAAVLAGLTARAVVVGVAAAGLTT